MRRSPPKPPGHGANVKVTVVMSRWLAGWLARGSVRGQLELEATIYASLYEGAKAFWRQCTVAPTAPSLTDGVIRSAHHLIVEFEHLLPASPLRLQEGGLLTSALTAGRTEKRDEKHSNRESLRVGESFSLNVECHMPHGRNLIVFPCNSDRQRIPASRSTSP